MTHRLCSHTQSFDLNVRILVPTVPHTGTRFMRDELLVGIEGVYVQHVRPPEMDDLIRYAEQAEAVIVPIRHPIHVVESWKVRSQPLEVLPIFWDNLSLILVHCEPLMLPMDQSSRDDYLKIINDSLGWSLQTSWPRVSGGRAPHCAVLTTEEIDLAIGIYRRHLSWLSKIYHEWI